MNIKTGGGGIIFEMIRYGDWMSIVVKYMVIIAIVVFTLQQSFCHIFN